MSLMIIFGVLMIAAGIWSLAAPGSRTMEWLVAIFGALMFISPWAGMFASTAGPAWTSWICGGIGVITGLWALAPAQRAHHMTHSGLNAAHA